jgi:hypothetical protein
MRAGAVEARVAAMGTAPCSDALLPPHGDIGAEIQTALALGVAIGLAIVWNRADSRAAPTRPAGRRRQQ